jgi:hypothetical protein
MRNPLSRQTKSRWTASSLTSLSLCVKAGGSTWKRGGSGKPQQNAAAMCGPSFGERPERQAAADRSMCSRLLSSGSQVRVLPGAFTGGRFGSGMSAIASADGMSRMVLWKRCGSAGSHDGRAPAIPGPRRRPSASRVPTAGRVDCSTLDLARVPSAVALVDHGRMAAVSGVVRDSSSSQTVRAVAADCRLSRKAQANPSVGARAGERTYSRPGCLGG